MDRIKILVLCAQNSCRSQMAEGLIRARFGDRVEVFSAGGQPAERIHPLAVETMKRRGIDISGQRPKSVELFMDERFDIVITTCDSARATCPIFPGGAEIIHWDLADPAAVEGAPDEVKAVFRGTAEKLESHIAQLEPLIDEINKRGD